MCNHQFREDIQKLASAGFDYSMSTYWCGKKYEYNKRRIVTKQGECDFKGNEKGCPYFVEKIKLYS